MHFRIVKLRIIPFLLQLKCTQILKKALQNLDFAVLQNPIFAYKVEDISVPAAHFIRSLEIRHPSNPTFAYKLVPFITYYTRVSRDALQNRRIAYNSIPFATDYTQSCEETLLNFTFAYNSEGHLRPHEA